MSHILDTPINFLKGVGEQKAEVLKKELGIATFNDLLHHYPFRYVDKSKFFKVADINTDTTYFLLKGKIKNLQTVGQGRSMRLSATFYDGSGDIELLWFKGIKWVKEFLKTDEIYTIYGKPKYFKGVYSMPHPEIEVADKDAQGTAMLLEPVYSTTEKLKTKYLDSRGLRKLCVQLLSKIEGHIEEVLSDELLKQTKLPSRATALKNIHFPQTVKDHLLARHRLVFEEFFFFSLKMQLTKSYRDNQVKGHVFESVGAYVHKFFNEKLPFELTDAQKRVIKEMRRDLASGRQMNRLLQGDVGSGKTLVALMLMLIAADNGYQSCIMAPTEILAQQHFNSFKKFLEGLGLEVALLTGTTKAKERKTLHEALENGKINILIGTHALIESHVKFGRLGLVVIDEQHRFGVAQRAKLWSKSKIPPHVMVMTATPIPRTLAMTIYGDLDVSVIDAMPPGRKPVKTYHVNQSARLKVFGFMRKAIKQGRQVYVVYPLIDESEALDLNYLMDGFESISRDFPLPEYAVSMVHGKMKTADKEYEMSRFVKGETDILVATTVIEVGVDVPNATIMVIENAERFGLAQLHQLRGRVGRGSDESYCILMTADALSEEGKKRINAMTSTTDGFKIAELDMQLRGAGDLQGLKQSGVPDFKIGDVLKDEKVLSYAKRAAQYVITHDPFLKKPENEIMLNYLRKITADKGLWGRIS